MMAIGSKRLSDGERAWDNNDPGADDPAAARQWAGGTDSGAAQAAEELKEVATTNNGQESSLQVGVTSSQYRLR